jgi:hypothetical protein
MQLHSFLVKCQTELHGNNLLNRNVIENEQYLSNLKYPLLLNTTLEILRLEFLEFNLRTLNFTISKYSNLVKQPQGKILFSNG